MHLKNSFLIFQGKMLSSAIQQFNLGNGSTWPGHLALKAHPHFIKDIISQSGLKTIFIVGTNGKTTTTTLLHHILTTAGKKCIQNISGANLLNGVASTLLLNATPTGKVKADIALFEIDENAFPLMCKEITPDMIILLNLFRDQLDRYGEVNSIALKWQEALSTLPEKTHLFLNADDPQIAFIGKNARQPVKYFGIDEEDSPPSLIDHASDSTYCPNCGEKLHYEKSYYSHLGVWSCPACHFKHPPKALTRASTYPLEGVYNKYNIHAATLVASELGIQSDQVDNALQTFTPAFGRQEKITVGDKVIEITLAKNPASFNQALATVLEKGSKNILLVLNDRVADGKDVSWIWDIDLELLNDKNIHLTLSGDRVYDLGLRAKYAGLGTRKNGKWEMENISISENLDDAISHALKQTGDQETLSILPTYTAMLEVRKILTGRKIL